jgi:hypothetical protein
LANQWPARQNYGSRTTIRVTPKVAGYSRDSPRGQTLNPGACQFTQAIAIGFNVRNELIAHARIPELPQMVAAFCTIS